MSKKEYIFGSVEEIEIEMSEDESEDNLLLKAFALIPAD